MLRKRLFNLILAVVMLFTAVFFSTGCGPKTFTVTFEKGAEDALLDWGEEIQVVTNSRQIVEPIYVRPGYNFAGWDRSISMIEGNTTVKALWHAYEFQVVFHANGGKTQNYEEVVVVKVGSAFELKQKQPRFIKQGFELSWDTNLSAITTSCTVNAVWAPQKYDLEFFDKDGLVFNNNKMQVTYNQKVEDVPVVAPEVSGKRFAYWSEEGDVDGITIDKGIIWRQDREVNFYANYVDADHYLIKYDLDGGEIGKRTYSYTADTDENANILFDAERIGYNFEGWLIGDSGVTKLSEDVTIKDFKVNGEYKDVTLKAVWGNRPYVIDYDVQGGILTGEDSKEVTYGQQIGQLPTAEKEGYVFVGWYYDGKIISENDLWEYPRDATLTAKYLCQYKIKFSLRTYVNSSDKQIDCKVVNFGNVSHVEDLEQVELTVVEGQSLYTTFNITKMPVVVPIEPEGKAEYEFADYWKWIDGQGNEHAISSTTVLDTDIFLGVQGGETVTLVPHCREIWSPNA
ncbi:MAG: InlB B-repeat-containing protein [Clostridia bacterium]|nr:InlB B-repeat-containing protein [Clostridia bacterium]